MRLGPALLLLTRRLLLCLGVAVVSYALSSPQNIRRLKTMALRNSFPPLEREGHKIATLKHSRNDAWTAQRRLDGARQAPRTFFPALNTYPGFAPLNFADLTKAASCPSLPGGSTTASCFAVLGAASKARA